MGKQSLTVKCIAFVATDGIEQVELTKPCDAIQDADAEVGKKMAKSRA